MDRGEMARKKEIGEDVKGTEIERSRCMITRGHWEAFYRFHGDLARTAPEALAHRERSLHSGLRRWTWHTCPQPKELFQVVFRRSRSEKSVLTPRNIDMKNTNYQQKNRSVYITKEVW